MHADQATARRRAQAVAETPEAMRVFVRAIRERRPLLASHRGELLLVCPHAVGRRGRDWFVLAFGYFDSRPGAFTSGSWRWLPTAELGDVELKGDFWLSTPPASRPSLQFLDEVMAQADEHSPFA